MTSPANHPPVNCHLTLTLSPTCQRRIMARPRACSIFRCFSQTLRPSPLCGSSLLRPPFRRATLVAAVSRFASFTGGRLVEAGKTLLDAAVQQPGAAKESSAHGRVSDKHISFPSSNLVLIVQYWQGLKLHQFDKYE